VLEKSRASNPNIAAAYTFEGTIYMLQNQVEKAREAFYKALALDPQDTEVRALLAETGGNTDAPPAGKGKGRGKR
ncbi:MAG: Tetratricopeptide repeat, partial [Pseudomonadota bacterium]